MMLKFDIKKIIAIIVAAIAVHGVAPHWCDWLMDCIIGKWLQEVFDFLSNYTVLSILLACLLLLSTLLWAWKIFKDKDFRWYRPFLILFVFLVLYDQNTLNFLPLWGKFDFRHLTFLLGIVVLLAIILKFLEYKCHIVERISIWFKDIIKEKLKKDESVKPKPLGFSDDNILPEATPAALKQYAWVISDLLMGTNIEEHSFAVGITGEWGSGKTTFLELLASVLRNRTELVWFNPWMCRTPEQVTDDFFATLQQQLSPRHSSLAKPLREYARYISNTTLSCGNGFLSRLTVTFPQESLQEKKKRLSDRFALIKKPVIVLIDDLDRLERDEVFEVLRLIRNTADLKNVIYIVAYDKEYVTSVLSEKSIKDASAYMEKIFPVEIHQPKVEDFQILHVLYNELLRINISEGKFARQLFSLMNQNEKQLIIKIIGNYRQAKRFVRTYLLNVIYIQKAFRNEIKLLDLFWMELLQMYDKSVYDLLSRNPEELLYRKDDRYILRPHIYKEAYVPKEEENYAYKGDKVWKEDTPILLEMVFSRMVRPKPSSICYSENFNKFFALGVSPYKVSLFELRNLLSKKGEEETIIRNWIDNGKYYASITYQLESVVPGALDDDQFESYLKGIHYFGMVIGEHGLDYGRVVKSMIEKSRYRTPLQIKGREIILAWYNERIKERKDLVIITRMLKRIYVAVEYDENMKQEPGTPMLISNDDVKELLRKALDTYLSVHPEVNALSIFYEKSEMGYIFSNCSILDVDGHPNEDYDVWENVAYDILHKYFSKQPKIPFEKYREAHQAMFMDDMPEWSDDDPTLQDYYENAENNRFFRMSAYFGTANAPFKKYLDSFFLKNDQSNPSEIKETKEKNDKLISKSKLKKKGIYKGK